MCMDQYLRTISPIRNYMALQTLAAILESPNRCLNGEGATVAGGLASGSVRKKHGASNSCQDILVNAKGMPF